MKWALSLVFLLVATAAALDCKDTDNRKDSLSQQISDNQCNAGNACTDLCATLLCQFWSLEGQQGCDGNPIATGIDDGQYNDQCGNYLPCLDGGSCQPACLVGTCSDVNQCSCDDGYSGIACDNALTSDCGNCQWADADDPQVFGELKYAFDSLPAKAALTNTPWSDTYWPSYLSGIAHRYGSRNPQDWKYKLYSKDELASLSPSVLQILSPAEKFDIYNQRYDYPTVHSEWNRTHPTDATWEGICHGWSPASLTYQNPNPVTLKNPDGVSIPFGSSDVKGLLSYFAAMYQSNGAEEQFVAGRCESNLTQNVDDADSADCVDINAGTFHVVIANRIGLNNIGFVADVDRSIEVWNQPISGYETKVLHREQNLLTVETIMSYTKERTPQFRKQDPLTLTKDYRYSLNLDDNGNIIGGTWSTWERPDFEWALKLTDFHGYFSSLKEIYESSISGRNSPLSLAKRVPLDQAKNYRKLGSSSGSFSAIGRIGQTYRWSIVPADASAITISFQKFITERHHGMFKVYEGATGDGALVAALSGSRLPQKLVINKPAVYVEFIILKDHTSSIIPSFKATYQAL